MTRIAAYVYAGLAGGVVLFQLSLALGAPLGHLAMGGFVEGRFSPEMRASAVFQGLLLLVFAWVVLSKAGLMHKPTPPRWAIWGVLIVSLLSLIVNVATPSVPERMLWASVAFVMFISVLWVKFHPLDGAVD
ncbi:MAG: hypothetical protein ACU0CA_01415 [Paracoccaceae bacterium]